MKYITFTSRGEPEAARLGALHHDVVIDLAAAQDWALVALRLPEVFMPASLFELIDGGPELWRYAPMLLAGLEGQEPTRLTAPDGRPVGLLLEEVALLPPLPRPTSLRDFYAFEQHVATANANRGRSVPEEWYRFPVFYFSNPNAIYGPDEPIPYPSYSQALDYELEIACVIGRPGINIAAERAEEHIFGYTIFNDWSARDVQRQEMKVGLGPAKGKDFASSFGPWIVTPDDIAAHHAGRPGVFDLTMAARVNGEERSRGNWKDLYFSFGEMIARASQEVWLLPGDILGSGTVGSGCLLELTRGDGPWLQPGDVVELEVEKIGVLRSPIRKRSGANY